MYNIKPFADANAIKVVAFGIEFTNRVDLPLVNSIIALYNNDTNLKESLPLMQPLNVTTIQISDGVQSQAEAIGGVQFLRLQKDGTVEMALKLQGNSLIVVCQSYSTWTEISSEALKYFSRLIPSITEQLINAITLEYVDEFITDDRSNKWIEELFNKDSKYICENVFDVDNFWHSNHGYFNTIEQNGEQIRVLNTVDINTIEETNNITKEIRHKAIIKMRHKAETSSVDSLEEIMTNLHNTDKVMLKNLLTENIQEMIGL